MVTVVTMWLPPVQGAEDNKEVMEGEEGDEEEEEDEEDSDSDDDNVQIHIGEIQTATTPMAYGRAPNYAKMMTLASGGKAEMVLSSSHPAPCACIRGGTTCWWHQSAGMLYLVPSSPF